MDSPALEHLVARRDLDDGRHVAARPELDLEVGNPDAEDRERPRVDPEAVDRCPVALLDEFDGEVDPGLVERRERTEEVCHVQDAETADLDVVAQPLRGAAEQRTRGRLANSHDVVGDQAVTATEQGERIKAELDDLLDEIDEVLESNAEDFVKSYVQKGGQ